MMTTSHNSNNYDLTQFLFSFQNQRMLHASLSIIFSLVQILLQMLQKFIVTKGGFVAIIVHVLQEGVS